jgi:hypothetical protein
MQKMIWTPRESNLLPLVHSTMHLPKCENSYHKALALATLTSGLSLITTMTTGSEETTLP